MYSFRPASDRIKLMHQLIRDRVIQTDAERALIVTESNKINEHVVPIIKRARAAYDVCSQMTVRIAGYSAYFVELNADCQNDIIRRTENAI
jgi:autonomous glycyl radical cofactor GrcA